MLIGTLAIAAARNVGSDAAAPPTGSTNRSAFLLVPTGRSRAEVENLLGAPRETRVAAGPGGESECWLYPARSGRPLTYRLCFSGGFLSTKSILPFAIDRLSEGRTAAGAVG